MPQKITLKGIVKYVDYEKHYFFVSATSKDVYKDSKGNIFCAGDIAYDNLNTGMPVKCVGGWDDQKFICEKVQPTWINLQTTMNYLCSNLKGKSIKTALINNVCSKYGRILFSTDRQELISKIKIDFPKEKNDDLIEIIDALHLKDKALCELEDFLVPYGIKENDIADIYEFCKKSGKKPLKEIKKNPYRILNLFEQDFKCAEQIAFDCEIKPYSDIRLAGLVRECLNICSKSGHTMIEPQRLVGMVSYKSRQYPYRTDIPAVLVSHTVLLQKEFILKDGFVSFYYLYRAELDIKRRLLGMKNMQPFSSVTASDIERIEQKLKVKYGNDQKNSFKMLSTGGVNILTGGPGTGKTTFIQGIIDQILYVKPDAIIKLCAPTGRAAKRMSEATGMPAETIHKMCNIQPYQSEEMINKMDVTMIDADFIICDEFSMVSAELASLLIKAMKNGTRFIIVGDEHQLPSIQAGNVLHDLIASGKFPVYRLEENFRQGNGGSIYENGQRILKKQMPYYADDFQIYKSKNEEDSYNALCYFMNIYYNKSSPYETQLIEPSRKGLAGTYKMNLFVHNDIVHANEENNTVPRENDKIIFEKTNYEMGYVNGDLGIIESVTKSIASINLEGEFIQIPRKNMADLNFAYSYTIHKSQGSESSIIIIYLPEKMKHMMTNPLLYTAVTRAKNKVIIIYEGNSLETCINFMGEPRKTRLLMLLQ